MTASRSVLHRLIQEAGGIVSTSDLMAAWGTDVPDGQGGTVRKPLSQTRFRQIEKHPDFPHPIGEIGLKKQRIYLKDEVDEFRHAMKHGAVRPRRGQ